MPGQRTILWLFFETRSHCVALVGLKLDCLVDAGIKGEPPSLAFRGQFVESVPLPCESWGWNSGHEAWWQVLYPLSHLASLKGHFCWWWFV